MFSFLKRKKEAVNLKELEEEKVSQDGMIYSGCVLSLLISHDKNLKIVVDWPEITSPQDVQMVSENMANLVVKCFDEVMLQYIIPVLQNTANARNEAGLLPTLFGLIENKIVEKRNKKASLENQPLISPIQMFKVRG